MVTGTLAGACGSGLESDVGVTQVVTVWGLQHAEAIQDKPAQDFLKAMKTLGLSQFVSVPTQWGGIHWTWFSVLDRVILRWRR